LGGKIDYFIEKTPLDNAGALFLLRDKIGNEPFFLFNAAAFDVDLNRMFDYHKKHGCFVTLFTHPYSHPYDSVLIIADKDGNVRKWLNKEEERPQWYKPSECKTSEVLGLSLAYLDINFNTSFPREKVDLNRQILKLLFQLGILMWCFNSVIFIDMLYKIVSPTSFIFLWPKAERLYVFFTMNLASMFTKPIGSCQRGKSKSSKAGKCLAYGDQIASEIIN
jgi:NDP-sugar pyrophosphorylase family protein